MAKTLTNCIKLLTASSFLLIISACTSGPPQLLNAWVGIEDTYTPSTERQQNSLFIFFEVEDPDGQADIAYLRLEILEQDIFWLVQREAIQTIVKGAIVRGSIRGINSDAVRFPAIIQLRVFDKAGNEDSRQLVINQPLQALQTNSRASQLSLQRLPGGFKIMGSEAVIVSQLDETGKTVLRKTLPAGTYQWSDWGQEVPKEHGLWLHDTVLHNQGTTVRNSGPW